VPLRYLTNFAQSVRPLTSVCRLIEVIRVGRLRVSVIADVLELDKPVSAWENFLPTPKPEKLLPILLEKDTLTPEGSNPDGNVIYLLKI
jgi:hypothetical protein